MIIRQHYVDILVKVKHLPSFNPLDFGSLRDILCSLENFPRTAFEKNFRNLMDLFM